MAEYIARKRLKGLGFTTDIGSLDAIKAEIFCLIDQEVLEQEIKKVKNGRRK